MKAIKKIVLLFVVTMIQNSISAQIVSTEPVKGNDIETIKVNPLSKNTEVSKLSITQLVPVSAPDSLNAILPKQYDPATMDSKPE